MWARKKGEGGRSAEEGSEGRHRKKLVSEKKGNTRRESRGDTRESTQKTKNKGEGRKRRGEERSGQGQDKIKYALSD